jgi:peptidoglycan/LPS O-acetylase OafA/YrhL
MTVTRIVPEEERERTKALTPQALLRSNMPELDSLRGVAILMVLFFHGFASRYGTEGLHGPAKFLVGLTAPGWAGVNLFFALSGFLITGILLDSKQRPYYYRRFYLRRALRILPAYYALLVLLPLFGRYGMEGESVSWKFLGLSAVYLANVTVLFGVPMQFRVLWSLAVEEHFYLLWPLVVRNLRRSSVGVFALLIAASVTLARVIAAQLGYDCLAPYTWLVADGLAFGCLLAVLARGPLGTRKGITLISAIALSGSLIIVLLAHYSSLRAALNLTALNLFCTATVGLTLVLGTGSWRSLVQWRILRFFGEISYGLYLVHMLAFNIFDSLQQALFPEMPSFKGHFGIMLIRFLVAGGAAVGLAALSRRHFEERFLRLKDRFLTSTTKVPGGEIKVDVLSGAVQQVKSA